MQVPIAVPCVCSQNLSSNVKMLRVSISCINLQRKLAEGGLVELVVSNVCLHASMPS